MGLPNNGLLVEVIRRASARLPASWCVDASTGAFEVVKLAGGSEQSRHQGSATAVTGAWHLSKFDSTRLRSPASVIPVAESPTARQRASTTRCLLDTQQCECLSLASTVGPSIDRCGPLRSLVRDRLAVPGVPHGREVLGDGLVAGPPGAANVGVCLRVHEESDSRREAVFDLPVRLPLVRNERSPRRPEGRRGLLVVGWRERHDGRCRRVCCMTAMGEL